MPYELRRPGQPPQTFASEDEAVAAAKQAMADDPDAELELYDTTTGKPAAPGASKRWREEMKNRVGF